MTDVNPSDKRDSHRVRDTCHEHDTYREHVPPERLQKLLAGSGAGSRRYCEELIRRGRIRVDGVTVSEMGVKVNPGSLIEIDGTPVTIRSEKSADIRYTYVLLNKPAGIISSARDQFGRKTVVDLVKDGVPNRVYPVGRLDYGTSGLILLTDDGDFTYRTTHPKFNAAKKYDVICGAPPGDGEINRLTEGVELGGGFRTAPALVTRDCADPRKITVTIREGKNRQVRRMMEAVGLSVRSLRRVAIGKLTIDGLASGEWRFLTREEAYAALE